MKRFFLFLFLTLCLVSCQSQKIETYVPPPIVETQPSWDGENQNSGLIDYIDGKGFLITPSAAQRYRSLTEKFGKNLTPNITFGEGLVAYEGNFILSSEYMSAFMEMSRLNKQ